MFNPEKSTVFVLGAGASWHYGYPTGEGLIEDVIKVAKKFLIHCECRLQSKYFSQEPAFIRDGEFVETDALPEKKWLNAHERCTKLVDRLGSVRPLVIDYFLGWNEELAGIGRFMIAAAILEREAEYLRERANINRRYDLERSPLKGTSNNPHL